MADVQILMVGGRRCGKSSVLSSLVTQLNTDTEILKEVIINYQQQKADVAPDKTLNRRQSQLTSFLNNNKDKYYLVDFGADKTFSYHPFKVRIQDGKGGFCWGNIDITFVDCPGESYVGTSEPDLYEKTITEIPQTDIFIIVVDTPYLMDEKSDTGKFQQVNSVIEITSLLNMNVSFNSDDDYKKIIFVPVKCEAWKDKLDQVANKIQQDGYYGSLISRIKQETRWSCCIIPALTAGGIKFAEFNKPLLLNGDEHSPCSPLGTKKVRMKDGVTHDLLPDETLVENTYHTLYFPYYSWFKNTGEYHPENCDQVALHVMRFLVFKTLVTLSHGIIPGPIKGFPTASTMRNMIYNLEDKGLIKDGNPNSNSVDKGIVNIRKIETRAEFNKY
jgi:GTPase SAR1 family protein